MAKEIQVRFALHGLRNKIYIFANQLNASACRSTGSAVAVVSFSFLQTKALKVLLMR